MFSRAIQPYRQSTSAQSALKIVVAGMIDNKVTVVLASPHPPHPQRAVIPDRIRHVKHGMNVRRHQLSPRNSGFWRTDFYVNLFEAHKESLKEKLASVELSHRYGPLQPDLIRLCEAGEVSDVIFW